MFGPAKANAEKNDPSRYREGARGGASTQKPINSQGGDENCPHLIPRKESLRDEEKDERDQRPEKSGACNVSLKGRGDSRDAPDQSFCDSKREKKKARKVSLGRHGRKEDPPSSSKRESARGRETAHPKGEVLLKSKGVRGCPGAGIKKTFAKRNVEGARP